MLNASGIGTYIRQIVPRVMEARPGDRFALLGRRSEAGDWSAASHPRASWIECSAPVYSLREQWEVPRRVPRDADLFWATHYNIPLCYRGRLLVNVHDVFHLAMPQWTGGWHRKLYAKALFDGVVRKAAAVLTISRFSGSELERLAGKPRNLTVTHLAAGPEWFVEVPGESPHPKPYFLFVGNVKPHKNLSGLLRGFALVKDHIPHDLVVVGKREGFITGDKGIGALAEPFGDRVRFTGYLEDSELRRFMARAEALVLPSYYEGFGLPPLEAMALGTPALLSRRASLPEVFGDAALYFEPDKPVEIGEALRRVAQEPALRRELSDKGRAKAREYSWEKTLAATLPVVEQALAGR